MAKSDLVALCHVCGCRCTQAEVDAAKEIMELMTGEGHNARTICKPCAKHAHDVFVDCHRAGLRDGESF